MMMSDAFQKMEAEIRAADPDSLGMLDKREDSQDCNSLLVRLGPFAREHVAPH